jgi:hypothetical protein
MSFFGCLFFSPEGFKSLILGGAMRWTGCTCIGCRDLAPCATKSGETSLLTIGCRSLFVKTIDTTNNTWGGNRNGMTPSRWLMELSMF